MEPNIPASMSQVPTGVSYTEYDWAVVKVFNSLLTKGRRKDFDISDKPIVRCNEESIVSLRVKRELGVKLSNEVVAGRKEFDLMTSQKLGWVKLPSQEVKRDSDVSEKSSSEKVTEKSKENDMSPKEAHAEVRRSSRGRGSIDAGSEVEK